MSAGRPSTMIRCFCIVILMAAVAGCKTQRSAHSESAPHSSSSTASVVDEAKVLAIARQAVATNDTWVDQAEFETPRRQGDGTWSVVVWRLPKVPGGHRLVIIDDTGKIRNYIRGR